MRKVFITLLVFPQILFASDYKWKESCARTIENMNECSLENFHHYDKQLNFFYKYALKRLNPDKKIELREEQRTWIKKRDPYCKEEADKQAEDEAFWTMKYEDCRGRLTEKRVEELKAVTRQLGSD